MKISSILIGACTWLIGAFIGNVYLNINGWDLCYGYALGIVSATIMYVTKDN